MNKYIDMLCEFVLLPMIRIAKVTPFLISGLTISCLIYLVKIDYLSAVICESVILFFMALLYVTERYIKKSVLIKDYYKRKMRVVHIRRDKNGIWS